MASFVYEWIRQDPLFNTVNTDVDPSIAIDSSGNAYVCYYIDQVTSGQTTYGNQDIRVFKLDSTGTFQWVVQKTSYNQYGKNSHPSIAVNSSGETCIAYCTATPTASVYATPYDITVFKLDTNGNTLWTTALTYSSDNEFEPSIAFDSSGDIRVTYWTMSRPGGTWDPAGPGMWEIRVGGTGSQRLYTGNDYYQTFKTNTGRYLKNICPTLNNGNHTIYLRLGEGTSGPIIEQQDSQ